MGAVWGFCVRYFKQKKNDRFYKNLHKREGKH